ncbi:MAG: hypothetical protein LQ351_008192 [Letrouitia transgressa]|nr:MAG: hypothetical protein LQ351_008192 [Letrouitia transgressa]
MVKFAFLFSLLSTSFLLATANPTSEISRRSGCLDDEEANKLLRIYISFFEKLDPKKAKKYLTPDFFEVSASLNFLFGKNYDAITYTNRTDFIDQLTAQQSQPLPPGTESEKFTVLSTVHDCHTIWFRWRDNTKPVPFFGFDEFYVKKDRNWQITKAYSEFNNAAALFNNNLFPCPGDSSTR